MNLDFGLRLKNLAERMLAGYGPPEFKRKAMVKYGGKGDVDYLIRYPMRFILAAGMACA